MQLVLIRLREAGQLTTYKANLSIKVHDYVVVEADRGKDYGEVLEINEVEQLFPAKKANSYKNVIRKMLEQDKKILVVNQKEAQDAMKLCQRKIKDYNLAMKLVDTEYSFDKKKLIFYFISDKRVDFRELVKELAKVFKVRIEMRQIGARDEAKLFGGFGPCGQQLCCCRFLKNFEPVTMKMAKIQKLPLGSGKISGICGRLMCCLSYEHKIYKSLSKNLPKEGQRITTKQGKGKVISVNVLKRIVYLEVEDNRIEKVQF
jgi:cell fate regulator YaaT (PSP1 superfamily)